jgi:putative transposase
MKTIRIPVPEALFEAEGGTIARLEDEIRLRVAGWLLAEDRLSPEQAAAMAGRTVSELPPSPIPALTPEPIPHPASLPASLGKDWPHAPLHRLSPHGNYLVTSGTYRKVKLFDTPEKLSLLEDQLLSLARQYGWQLEAWAVLANHYHFVAYGTADAHSIRSFLRQLHADTARDLNQMDGVADRQVWHNFWDTRLTFEKSYLARLNYVHQNPVKHGLVRVANQYPWCSAAWFERTARRSIIKTIYSFKIDRLQIPDDF